MCARVHPASESVPCAGQSVSDWQMCFIGVVALRCGCDLSEVDRERVGTRASQRSSSVLLVYRSLSTGA